jgi:hypothetical protein
MLQASTRLALLASLAAAFAGCGPTSSGGNNPCALTGEPQGNHSRDTAAGLTIGTAVTGCLAKGDEHDWYEFTVPGDAAGGIVKVDYTEVGAFTPMSSIYAAADNGMLSEQYADNSGQSLTVWFAAAPGQKYRIDTHGLGGTSADVKYTMKASYTKVDDTFEPNDTQGTAKALTSGTPVNAFMFTGYKGGSITDTEYADWYTVNVTGSTLTAVAENVPTDVEVYMEAFDSGGSSLGYEIGQNLGASTTLAKTGLAPGTYAVMLKPFAPNNYLGTGKGATAPDHFTRAYKLTVGP